MIIAAKIIRAIPVILPILCFIAIFLIVKAYRVLGWRGSFLFSAVCWGILLTIFTEVLSLLSLLAFWPLVIAWAFLFICLLIILVVKRSKLAGLGAELREKFHLLTADRFEVFLLLCLVLIVCVIGVIAWVAPPNTWDSMTYHMSRVVHWIQNRSVAFYPTHILRQLHQNPWSEYAILHFQVLAGNDRLANFIQWFGMLGSLIGVSAIAKELGASRRGQILAAVACGTIPMGILQASSTQNDCMVSFWLVAFVYFVIFLKRESVLLYALAAGGALGLAILTKATAYVFALPFLIWLCLSALKPLKKKKIWWIAAALAIAFAINLGHYARNFDLYGSPLGPGSEGPDLSYSNEVFSVPVVLSNLVRNVGLHLGTPSSIVNRVIERQIVSLHTLLNISVSDPRTSFEHNVFHVPALSFGENTAGNFVHLFLILGATLLAIFLKPRDRDALLYILMLFLGFLLFSAYLKWQPWNSRLHLPFFVLFTPIIGLMFSRIRQEVVVDIGALLVILSSLPWVLGNASRPIFGRDSIFAESRTEQYFSSNPALLEPYTEAAEIISGIPCSNVGLILNINSYEYPLWVLIHERVGDELRFEHVLVENISRKKTSDKPDADSVYCAIFTENVNPADSLMVGNQTFRRVWSSSPFNVYTPK